MCGGAFFYFSDICMVWPWGELAALSTSLKIDSHLKHSPVWLVFLPADFKLTDNGLITLSRLIGSCDCSSEINGRQLFLSQSWTMAAGIQRKAVLSPGSSFFVVVSFCACVFAWLLCHPPSYKMWWPGRTSPGWGTGLLCKGRRDLAGH